MLTRLSRNQLGLVWLALLLLGGTGCGIDSRVTGEWQTTDAEGNELLITFNKNGTVNWGERTGTWSVVRESGMTVNVKTEGIGYDDELRCVFMTKDQGSFAWTPNDKLLVGRVDNGDDEGVEKSYALGYIIMSIFVVLSMSAICRPSNRYDEPPAVKVKRDEERARQLGRSHGH